MTALDNYADRAVSELSFKDYVSTFVRGEEVYAKFYQKAIRKHREQVYSQMS